MSLLLLTIIYIFSTCHAFYPAPTSGCDLITSDGRCFSYFTNSRNRRVNWATARTRCGTWRGDLATITSSKDETLIVNIKNNGQRECWIGLNDIGQNNVWKWADGSNSTFENWEPGVPTSRRGGRGQDCVTKDWRSPKWDDTGCSFGQRCYYCSTQVFPFQIQTSTAIITKNNAGVSESIQIQCITETKNTQQVIWRHVGLNGSESMLSRPTDVTTGVSTLSVLSDSQGYYACMVTQENGATRSYGVTVMEVPTQPPLNISVSSVSSKALNVTWTLPPNSTYNGILQNVQIQYKGMELDSEEKTVMTSITDSSSMLVQYLIVTDLEEHVNYSVRLSVSNIGGFSRPSQSRFERTQGAVPSAPPQNITTESLSPTSIRVRWYPPPGIDQNGPITMYSISYTGQIFHTNTMFVAVNVSDVIYPAVSAMDFNITGLEEYNNYSIRVSAVNQEGASGFSISVNQVTNIAAPSASSSLIVQDVTSTYFIILITPPPLIEQNGPLIIYEARIATVQFGIALEYRNFTIPLTNDLLSMNYIFNISGLEEFVEYNISVRAYTIASSGPYSTVVQQRTEAVAPDESPQNVTVTTISATRLRVCFYPPAGINQNGIISAFHILYRGISLDTELHVMTLNVTYPVYPLNGRLCDYLRGLEEYNYYNVSVQPINQAGVGPDSASILQLTNEDAPSAPPQNFTASLISDNISLAWSPPLLMDQNGITTSYTYTYMGVERDRTSKSITVSSSVFSVQSVTGLDAYTTYIFTIRATTIIGSGPESKSVSLRTEIDTPPPPTDLQNYMISFNTSTCSAVVSLTWMTPASIRTVERYFLYLNQSLITTTNYTNYNHSTVLSMDTDYQYSLVASTYAGNSTRSNFDEISISDYSIGIDTNASKCLVYDRFTGEVTMNWNLNAPVQVSGVVGVEITYSLNFFYTQRRLGVTNTYTNFINFSLPSSHNRYSTIMNHGYFIQQDAVETNITAKLRVTQQCGQYFNGTEITCTSRSDTREISLIPNIAPRLITFDGGNTTADCIDTYNRGLNIYWRNITTLPSDHSVLFLGKTLVIQNQGLPEGNYSFECVGENHFLKKRLQLMFTFFAVNKSPSVINQISNSKNVTLNEVDQGIELVLTYSNSYNSTEADDAGTFEALVNSSLILAQNLERYASNVSDFTINNLIVTTSNLLSFSDLIDLGSSEDIPVLRSNLITIVEILGAISLSGLNGQLTERIFISERVMLISQRIPLGSGQESLFIIPTSENFNILESVSIPQTVVEDLSINGEFRYSIAIIDIPLNPYSIADTFLGSRLLSLVVSNERESGIYLASPIQLEFFTPNALNQEASCVFLSNGNSMFNTSGLTLISTEGNSTICESTHLTSFGVLIRARDQNVSRKEALALSIVSYILLSCSLIALILSISISIVIRKEFFKVEMNRIYFNYSLALALAITAFIFGTQLPRSSKIACSVFVFLMHYFWLAVFSWGLCISVEIVYLLWVTSLDRKALFWYLLPFGWGLPIPIVVTTIITTHIRYGLYAHPSAEFCFLAYENGIIWSFIAPILVLLFFNMIGLIMATVKIVQISNSAGKRAGASTLTIAKHSLINSSILFPVMGLPWIVLPFSLIVNSLIPTTVFEWFFIILASPSGVLFFILFTLRNELVRQKLFRKNTSPPSKPNSKQITCSSNTLNGRNSSNNSSVNTLMRYFTKQNTLERQIAKDTGKKVAEIGGGPKQSVAFYEKEATEDPPVYKVESSFSNPLYKQNGSTEALGKNIN